MGLYVLIGAVAVALRLFHLGSAPLSSAEAREALAVWRFVMGQGAPIQPVSPAWFTLTSAVFTLFGASEFWARFWPAVAGAALIFFPLTFRRELGRAAALIACALLAISPVMMAASRAADGTMLAAVGVWLMAYGVSRKAGGSGQEAVGRGQRFVIIVGVGLGLGLAAGPRFVAGVLAVALMVIMSLLTRPTLFGQLRIALARTRQNIGPLLLTSAISFVLFLSAALMSGGGLSAAGDALPRWINGWRLTADTRAPWLVPQMLLAYEPLGLMLGIVGLYSAFVSRHWRTFVARLQGDDRPFDFDPLKTVKQLLGAALVGGLLYSIAYTGREAGDAVWAVIPLAMLAGVALAQVFSSGVEMLEGDLETAAAQTGVLFVILIFAYFNLAAFARSTSLIAVASPYPISLLLAIGVIALGALVTVLFAAGWSKAAAVRGAIIAVGAVMLIGALGAGWKLTQTRADDPRELWTPAPTTSNLRLMIQTIEDVSDRYVGNKHEAEIVVLNDPARDDAEGVLGWELRDFTKVEFVDALSPAVNAPIVIADESVSDPKLGSDYVGEKFAVFARQADEPLTLDSAANWWLFRAGAVEYSRKVVWVRGRVEER